MGLAATAEEIGSAINATDIKKSMVKILIFMTIPPLRFI
jgi:hypothetical protein